MRNKCKQCGLGCMNSYCNDNCRKKWAYHNDKEYRLTHIERVKNNTVDKRETDKFNKQREENAALIKQAATIDPKIMELYLSVYGKR